MSSSSPNQLVEWLKANMEKNNWGIREVARRAGVSHPTISDLLNGKEPSLNTSVALAKLFNTTPEFILTLAGIFPKKSNDDLTPKKRELMYLAEQADDETIELAIAVLTTAWERKKRLGPANGKRKDA